MLKVYHVDSYYKIDDEDWSECGSRGYTIRDESEAVTRRLLDEANWDEVYGSMYDGVCSETTLFGKRPYISVYRGWMDDKSRRLYHDDFSRFSYEYRYTEWTGCPLEWIMKHASAEQTIQYMKERGMTVCPLQ